MIKIIGDKDYSKHKLSIQRCTISRQNPNETSFIESLFYIIQLVEV